MDLIRKGLNQLPTVNLYDFEDKTNSNYESFFMEKKNGKLKFISNGCYQTRNSSTIWCIEQADALFSWPDFGKIKILTNDGFKTVKDTDVCCIELASTLFSHVDCCEIKIITNHSYAEALIPWLDFGKIKILTNDGYTDALFSWQDYGKIKIITNANYSKETEYEYSSSDDSYKNLVPDFNFCKWQEVGINDYVETCNEIKEAGKQTFLIDKVGWIGNFETHTNRMILKDLGRRFSGHLDIRSIDWTNKFGFMSMPELVKTYSLLLDIEGYGYSGRLKYLLFSLRPLLLVDRPQKEFFFEFLKPWVHYIPVNRDLSDLLEQVLWAKNNYHEALKIAKAAAEFAEKYCTREAAFQQWNKIIQEIS